MASVKIKDDLYWVGIQDHDLRVFDVVMYTEFGTSYNSYLLKTAKGNVLFETVKEKFFDTFLENLKSISDLSEIKYIVVDHTEPDHAGSIEKLLELIPDVKVVGSSVALNFLKDICNREIPGISVEDNQEIDMDNYRLKFLSVPFLHWPDSIYTYIDGLSTMITCDSFGCHYADDKVCNDLIQEDFVDAYKYYFHMIMGPFKKHVRYALERIKEFKIETICPGHGPVLREKLDYYFRLYEDWSYEDETEKKDRPIVIIPYVSAYGYTKEIADNIVLGIKEEVEANIRLHDMVNADPHMVSNELFEADGILFGTPTINGEALPPISSLVAKFNAIAHGGKVAGVFGSYGWSGEGPEMLISILKLLRMEIMPSALKVKFKPGEVDKQKAKEYGKKFGVKLKEKFEANLDNNEQTKSYWKCTVCGEVFEGALSPTYCPACGAGAEAFIADTPEVVTFENHQEMKVVIVGSGIAALSTAESIRKRNNLAQIDLYTREEVFPYYRPMLSHALYEDMDEKDFFVHPESFYKENKINIHFKKEVTQVDPQKKEITVGDNEKIPFDRLVLATGAKCFVPPIKGADLNGVFTLREHRDMQQIRDLVRKDKKRIVVVGGGLLGLEIANSLSMLNHEVTVCEVANTILPMQLDNDGSQILETVVQKSRINCKLGVMVEEICGDQTVSAVKIKGGETLDCDLVIVSAGIRSNIELAESKIDLDRAIKVSDKMLSSGYDIFAVGDCSIVDGRFFGLWEPALEQGKVAGAVIAGEQTQYKSDLNAATLSAFGTKVFSVGDLGRDQERKYQQVSVINEMKGIYKKLYFEQGKLVGGVLIGELDLMNPILSGIKNSISYEDAFDQGLF